jgi:hypothetical protein
LQISIIPLHGSLFGMEIGITIVSDKHPNTIDSFWFAIRPEAVVNPFDFVTVEHVHDTKCIGMVQYSQIFRDENSKDDSFTDHCGQGSTDG